MTGTGTWYSRHGYKKWARNRAQQKRKICPSQLPAPTSAQRYCREVLRHARVGAPPQGLTSCLIIDGPGFKTRSGAVCRRHRDCGSRHPRRVAPPLCKVHPGEAPTALDSGLSAMCCHGACVFGRENRRWWFDSQNLGRISYGITYGMLLLALDILRQGGTLQKTRE